MPCGLHPNSGSDGGGPWRWFSNFLTSMPLHLILQGWFRSSVGVEYQGKARKRWSYSGTCFCTNSFLAASFSISVSSVAVKFSSAGYTHGRTITPWSRVVGCCLLLCREFPGFVDSLYTCLYPSAPPSPTLWLFAFGVVALVEACDKCGRSWFWGSRYLFASEERFLKFGVSVGDLQFARLSFWKFTTVLQMAIAENCWAV